NSLAVNTERYAFMKNCIRLGFGALVLLVHLNALAHTAMTASVPAGDAVVAAPSELQLTFNGPVSLVKLEVINSTGTAVDVGFRPIAAPAAQFSLALPELMEGAYTINWAAIGGDGHTVSDSFTFRIDPA